MKVLFATYPMAFHTPGGGEIQLLAYKKALEEKGIQVDLLDPWNPNFSDYDLVHFFSCVGGSIHFCNFVKNLGIPLVITSSLWITEETKCSYPIDEIRAQLDLADVIIANSDTECDKLSEVLNLQREKFSTVYNGVDKIFFEHPSPKLFREHFDIQNDFVLNVGNIEPRKNQLTLAEAICEFPDKKLILIGHIRDQEYYEKILDISQNGQVVYLGPLEHDSPLLRSAYQACDLFCLPSTLETPGLAALEAAAQGSRCLVTSVGSTVEYFGENIAAIEPYNINNLSDLLKERFEVRGLDNEINTNQMKNFLWSSVTNDLESIYKRLAKNDKEH